MIMEFNSSEDKNTNNLDVVLGVLSQFKISEFQIQVVVEDITN
jgi:hypothetical protein